MGSKRKRSELDEDEKVSSQNLVGTSSSLFCHICTKQFNDIIPFSEHLESKTHRLKAKEFVSSRNFPEPMYEMEYRWMENPTISVYCNECNVKATGLEPFIDHLRGRKHLREVAEMIQKASTVKAPKLIKDYLERLEILKRVAEKIKQNLSCELCCKRFTGKVSYNKHMDGKRHSTMLRKISCAEKTCKEALKDGESLRIYQSENCEGERCFFATTTDWKGERSSGFKRTLREETSLDLRKQPSFYCSDKQRSRMEDIHTLCTLKNKLDDLDGRLPSTPSSSSTDPLLISGSETSDSADLTFNLLFGEKCRSEVKQPKQIQDTMADRQNQNRKEPNNFIIHDSESLREEMPQDLTRKPSFH